MPLWTGWPATTTPGIATRRFPPAVILCELCVLICQQHTYNAQPHAHVVETFMHIRTRRSGSLATCERKEKNGFVQKLVRYGMISIVIAISKPRCGCGPLTGHARPRLPIQPQPPSSCAPLGLTSRLPGRGRGRSTFLPPRRALPLTPATAGTSCQNTIGTASSTRCVHHCHRPSRSCTPAALQSTRHWCRHALRRS